MIDDTIDTKESANMLYSNELAEQRAERDFTLLETLTLHIARKNRLKKYVCVFLINMALFIADLLFLTILVLLFDDLPFFVFKLGTLTTLIIAISYFSSLQARRLYHTKLQEPEHPIVGTHKSEHDDRQYLALIKQDTTAYLYALKTKVLRKGAR